MNFLVIISIVLNFALILIISRTVDFAVDDVTKISCHLETDFGDFKRLTLDKLGHEIEYFVDEGEMEIISVSKIEAE